ncbi:hypothetical protein KR054_000405 [Drosophila jambulina]|nr:hypothetical protein KR054_000405 [Drosophila jambulina]
MAHNSTVLTRKSKSSRTGYASRSQQITDNEPPKEKVPKMTSTRDVRGKVPTTATKITATDLHRLGVCQMVSPSKTPGRAAGGGGGGATPGQKYHREQSYTSSPPKTTRATSTAQKLTPKESRAVREQTEFKDFKSTKEYKDLKEAKAFKEVKAFKEPKDLQPKGADRSPNLSHRHARHQSDRTKNYFDKYLKFAFDLSTPEGVKQLEAHFFPDKDLSGAGTSTNREE